MPPRCARVTRPTGWGGIRAPPGTPTTTRDGSPSCAPAAATCIRSSVATSATSPAGARWRSTCSAPPAATRCRCSTRVSNGSSGSTSPRPTSTTPAGRRRRSARPPSSTAATSWTPPPSSTAPPTSSTPAGVRSTGCTTSARGRPSSPACSSPAGWCRCSRAIRAPGCSSTTNPHSSPRAWTTWSTRSPRAAGPTPTSATSGPTSSPPRCGSAAGRPRRSSRRCTAPA